MTLMNVRSVLVCGLTIASALAVAGCGGGSVAGGGPTGTVHGMIVLTGGPRGASPVGAGGTVVVTKHGDEVAHQNVAEGNEFQFSLSAGKYRLSVRGVSGSCVDQEITIVASADQAVSLICQRK
jgi:hypothetical protein